MATSTSKKTTSSTTKKRASTSPAVKTAKAAKPATSKVPSPADVPPKAMPATQAASQPAAQAMPDGPEMKKQELLEKVVRLSGVKKKDAKPVVEAMLEVLGETLAEGRGLNLQPLGKLKLNRTKETPNARIIVAKLRQSKAARKQLGGDNQTVAAAAE